MCIARLGVFMPCAVGAAIAEATSRVSWASFYVVVAAFAAAACAHLHAGIDTHFILCAVLSALYLRAAIVHGADDRVTSDSSLAKASRPYLACIVAGLAALAYGIVPPVLGLQNMSALTMYGNLKHWGGSNHLLLPTFQLHEWASSLPTDVIEGGGAAMAHFAHAFGSHSIVRVDSTNSSVLAALSPADSTFMLPSRAVAMLRAAGASGRYYGNYCARLFWGRTHDLPEDGTIGNGPSASSEAVAQAEAAAAAQAEPIPYALPWYELQRLLYTARTSAPHETFQITFTRMPARLERATPAKWRDYRGDEVERGILNLVEHPASSTRTCTVGIRGQPCSAHDVAELASAPSPWLSKVLMTYPVPLLPESEADPGSEIHCSA